MWGESGREVQRQLECSTEQEALPHCLVTQNSVPFYAWPGAKSLESVLCGRVGGGGGHTKTWP